MGFWERRLRTPPDSPAPLRLNSTKTQVVINDFFTSLYRLPLALWLNIKCSQTYQMQRSIVSWNRSIEGNCWNFLCQILRVLMSSWKLEYIRLSFWQERPGSLVSCPDMSLLSKKQYICSMIRCCVLSGTFGCIFVAFQVTRVRGSISDQSQPHRSTIVEDLC